MTYNDFPILDNEKYKMLNNQYNNNFSTDRKTYLNEICEKLNFSRNICLHLTNKFNIKIRKAIEQTSNTLTKLFDNFTFTFGIDPQASKTTQNFNLFSFSKLIIEICKLIINWLKIENKEYYSSMARKCLLDLFDCLSQISSALEESNLHLFKYM